MPTNDFYEFATSSAAYVEDLADYLADVERTAGQQSGIARAELNNRALRQGSAMAAAIGSFMVSRGYDALDDGDTAARAANFAAAVAALIQPNIANAVNAAKVDVLQRVFPVGSIYTSYNINTNPAQLLGFGIWTAVQGRFLLSASSAYPAGSTGGAASHAITVSELPAHSHTASATSAGEHTHTATTASTGAHTHTRGSMNITGTISASVESYAGDITGAFYQIPNYATVGDHRYVVSGFGFDASRSWTGATSSDGAHTHTVTVQSAGAHTHTVTVGNTGDGSPMSLLPPYVAVYMWRRTA